MWFLDNISDGRQWLQWFPRQIRVSASSQLVGLVCFFMLYLQHCWSRLLSVECAVHSTMLRIFMYFCQNWEMYSTHAWKVENISIQAMYHYPPTNSWLKEHFFFILAFWCCANYQSTEENLLIFHRLFNDLYLPLLSLTLHLLLFSNLKLLDYVSGN